MPAQAQAVTQVFYNGTGDFANMGVAISTATFADGEALDMSQITSQPFWDALSAASAAPVYDVILLASPLTVSPYVYSDQPNATAEFEITMDAAMQTVQQTSDVIRLGVAAALGVNVSDVFVDVMSVGNSSDAFITVTGFDATQLQQDLQNMESTFVQAMADAGMPAATGAYLYLSPPAAPPPSPLSTWAYTTYASFVINSTAPDAFDVVAVTAALAQVSAWPGTVDAPYEEDPTVTRGRVGLRPPLRPPRLLRRAMEYGLPSIAIA